MVGLPEIDADGELEIEPDTEADGLFEIEADGDEEAEPEIEVLGVDDAEADTDELGVPDTDEDGEELGLCVNGVASDPEAWVTPRTTQVSVAMSWNSTQSPICCPPVVVPFNVT